MARAFLKGKFGANIGCGKASFVNKINVDVLKNKKTDPDILADVRCLPFRDDVFDEIVFTEVLEHTPKGSELQAMMQIERVLKQDGTLVFSVPNQKFISKMIDPIFFTGHRHYSRQEVTALFQKIHMQIKHVFSSGTIPFGVITFTYALNWLFGKTKPNFWGHLATKSYSGAIGNCGGTLFVIAKKES